MDELKGRSAQGSEKIKNRSCTVYCFSSESGSTYLYCDDEGLVYGPTNYRRVVFVRVFALIACGPSPCPRETIRSGNISRAAAAINASHRPVTRSRRRRRILLRDVKYNSVSGDRPTIASHVLCSTLKN